jgi:molybdate transport system substrate-binding protein
MTQTFDQANNCNIIVNLGSSGSLYTQITAGSPCDVFMSADTKWITQLNSAGLTLNNPVKFTNNSLCIIVAQDNPKNIQNLGDLINPGVKIVIADPSVPVGSYTNQTITKITSAWGNSSSPQYDSSGAYVNYYTNFQSNVVNKLGTDEQVVGAVSLNVGTADAGIVFYSDWAYANMTGARVQFIAIPASVNTLGNYGIVVPSETTQATLAQTFMNYWSTQDGQKLLAEFGFGAA